jgi:hypothetical protein
VSEPVDLGDTSPELPLTECLTFAMVYLREANEPITDRLFWPAYERGICMLHASDFPDDEGRALYESIRADVDREEQLWNAGFGPLSEEKTEEFAKRIRRLAARYGVET